MKRVQLNVSDGDHVTVGDVIQCSSNTIYPSVSYHWQQYVNESWQQLQQQDDDDDDDDDDDGSGLVLRLSTVGVHVMRCVAYNVVQNFKNSVTSGNVTLFVVEPGKCFKYVQYTVKCYQQREMKLQFVDRPAVVEHDLYTRRIINHYDLRAYPLSIFLSAALHKMRMKVYNCTLRALFTT